jgi:hypothetical protein
MYCDECGLELKEVEERKFDIQTGKKATRAVCPTGKCGHFGVPHKWKLRMKLFSSRLIYECRVCNKNISEITQG